MFLAVRRQLPHRLRQRYRAFGLMTTEMNQVTLPVNTTSGAVFFRLISP
jgi:hypothetical protein